MRPRPQCEVDSRCGPKIERAGWLGIWRVPGVASASPQGHRQATRKSRAGRSPDLVLSGSSLRLAEVLTETRTGHEGAFWPDADLVDTSSPSCNTA